MEQAFATAYATNPTLIAARAGVKAVDEGVPSARAGMLPNVNATATVGASYTEINGSTPADSNQPRSVSLNAAQVLYDGGRTWNSVDAAVSGVDAARSRLIDTEQNVLLQVVTSYMNVRRDQQFVALGRNNVRVISEQLRAANDRFAVGEVTRTDVSQASARLAQSRASLAAREGNLAQSFQSYARVVGAPPGDLSAPPPYPPLPATLAEAVAEALDRHPAVRAARYDEEQSRSDIATAQGALLPTVALTGSVSYGENLSASFSNGQSTATVQLRASIPLYQSGAAYSDIRRAQAVQSQRVSQIHEITRAVQENVENAWTSLMTARITIQAGREQVEASQLAYEGVTEEAKLGARTTLDVLDAEQELLNARTNLVASERDEYVAAYSVLAAMGRLTVSGLGVDVAIYDPNVNYADVNDRRFGFDADELTEWRSPIAP
ncbi:TolC family outer membrane protein [Pikeienuella piscinae]|uniref:TolC family outer membrane protein n=1 Tax=Pikeienuella piscinae TaxID=2748098 RepID=A0A7L5BTJ4_9RHOB|nr:TolC family outer membrane protein [Pikeienuella piscinae]QIE55370.1 TolC family outer membrane protein [Pikeienuella piscinae]